MRKALAGHAVAVAALLVASSVARAQVSTTGTWNPMVAPTNGGAAFWDNASSDGRQCNIGFFLLYTAGNGYGPCSVQKPTDPFVMGNAGRLGTTGGAPNGSFLSHAGYSFAAGTYQIDFLGNIAGYDPTGAFGQELWAFTDGLNGPVALQQFYAVGSYPNGLTTTFSFTSASAWYLGAKHAYGSNGWDYSNTLMSNHGWALFSEYDASSANQGAGERMFAAFGDVPAGDQDYNDLVLQVSSVPEPESLLLIGTGVLGLLVVLKRRV